MLRLRPLSKYFHRIAEWHFLRTSFPEDRAVVSVATNSDTKSTADRSSCACWSDWQAWSRGAGRSRPGRALCGSGITSLIDEVTWQRTTCRPGRCLAHRESQLTLRDSYPEGWILWSIAINCDGMTSGPAGALGRCQFGNEGCCFLRPALEPCPVCIIAACCPIFARS